MTTPPHPALDALRGVVLLLVVLAASCGGDEAGPAATPTPPRAAADAPTAEPLPKNAPVVVFLGDSLSAGLGLPAHQAFPAVLQRSLAKAGTPFRLVNAGVSGDTTGAGLGRLPWLLKQDPDVVVVELGANDAFRGMDLAQMEENLRAIVARVSDHGAAVLLLGMRLPPSYGQAYARGFDALYDRIAEDTGVDYVPFFMRGVAGVAALQQGDGIHPTAEGHRQLAANLQEPLLRLLRDVLPAGDR